MSKQRKSAPVPQPTMTIEQVDVEFGQYATLRARIEAINAKMNEELTKVRNKYNQEMAKLVDEAEAKFNLLQGFALQNQGALFSDKKSREFTHGIMGFRTGNPAVKQVKGFTQASSLQLAKEFLTDAVRTKEELDKEWILAHRNEADVAPLLPKIGVHVEQTETFYVEPFMQEVFAA